MRKTILLTAMATFFVGIGALFFAFENHKRNDSPTIEIVDRTPNMDEQWQKIKDNEHWVLDRSSFVGTSNAQPYTYRLKTNDSTVGCSVTPVFNQNTILTDVIYGVVIFEEGTDYVSEASQMKINNKGRMISSQIVSNERYDFNIVCKQYISQLPPYVRIFFFQNQ
ncbi:MAG: hypothetical protein HY363_03805 [Candidatus Aenigmarchaeota archaeon]|nr:hypothetical protein [Parcubacteria group bacterium]MBI4016792.1 hypothetical protein [Candidatus Aenigmarchaeota archaeon]